jgi:hypothetical protein
MVRVVARIAGQPRATRGLVERCNEH